MLREVIGSISAAFTAIIILWFILPILRNVHITVVGQVETTDPGVIQLIALADWIYVALTFIIVGVTAFIILSYASRRDPFDVSVNN